MPNPLDLDALAGLATWNDKRSVHYADQAAEAWRSSTSGVHARMLETISAKHGDTADGILALLAALKEARERLDLIAAEYAIYDNARSGQPGLDLNDVARFVNAVRTLTDRSEAP